MMEALPKRVAMVDDEVLIRFHNSNPKVDQKKAWDCGKDDPWYAARIESIDSDEGTANVVFDVEDQQTRMTNKLEWVPL